MGKCKNEEELNNVPEFVRYNDSLNMVIGVDFDEKLYMIKPVDHEPGADDKQWVRWESVKVVGPDDEVLKEILEYAHSCPVNPVECDVMCADDDLLPEYKTAGSAGCDLKANIEVPVTLQPLERHLFPTGFHIAMPRGYEAQVRPRSGLAKNHGIVTNMGTIDSDYRGEVGVILFNLSNEPYTVQPRERIAQLVIAEHSVMVPNKVSSLDETDRGTNGFGSTGK